MTPLERKFRVGGGLIGRTIRGGVWIFSGTTQWENKTYKLKRSIVLVGELAEELRQDF